MKRPSAIDIFVADAMLLVGETVATCPTPARRVRLLTHTCAFLDEELLHPADRRRDHQLALERVRRLCGDMLAAEEQKAVGEAAA